MREEEAWWFTRLARPESGRVSVILSRGGATLALVLQPGDGTACMGDAGGPPGAFGTLDEAAIRSLLRRIAEEPWAERDFEVGTAGEGGCGR